MKKIIALLMAMLILFGTVGTVMADAAPEKMYIWVAVNSVGGDGSKDKPFGTFEEARDKIREIKANGEYPEGGIVVYFREGVYPMTNTMTLTAEDSGKEGAPVVYRAYMEEQVSFVGGVELPVSQFKKVTDPEALKRLYRPESQANVLCANLKEDFGITEYGELNMYGMGLGYYTNAVTNMKGHGVIIPTEQPPELFFGNESGQLAKYPNDGWIFTGTIIQTGDEVQWWSSTWLTSAQFVPEEERVYPPKPSIWEFAEPETKNTVKKWVNEDDIWIYGTLGENWSDNSLPVKEIDSNKGIITTKFPSPKLLKKDMKYYIYNVLGELDKPGEYYLDRNTGVLYIYPTDLNGTVTFSNLKKTLLVMNGVENVSFKSVAFKGSLTTLVQVNGCINCTFELCSFSKSAKTGIGLTGKNNKLISCHIYQMGTGGVSIGTNKSYNAWIADEADQNLTPQNQVIENCEIENVGRINATYSPHLTLSGVGNLATNCYIHDGEHMAMSLGGNDNTVEYCEFTDLLRSADDSGLIYAGYALQRQGYVIRHNYFHDIVSTSTKPYDISMWYPDDTMRGWTVQSNLIVNTSGRGMHSNGGATHTVTDNIAISLGGQFVNFGWHESDLSGKYAWEKYDFQKYLDNPAYAKYKNFADLTPANYLRADDITVDRNVIWGTGGDITGPAYTTYASESNFNKSYDISSDPGFVDMANGDYTLRDDSIIYKKFPEFQAPDFKNMGMYTGKLQGLLGENKAFLVGSPKVYNGWNPEAITARHDAVPMIKDGVYYLPVRYITEVLGGEVKYDEKTEAIEINYANPVTLNKGDYIEINGTSFISVDEIVEIFGMEVKTFSNGVIILGEVVRIEETDVKIIEELHRRLYNE